MDCPPSMLATFQFYSEGVCSLTPFLKQSCKENRVYIIIGKMGKKRTIYKKQDIPFFIRKLITMLDNETNQQIIKWNSSANGFLILNEEHLISKLLPLHFNHHNLSSFVRQLNLYGFHKQESVFQYFHPNFQRANPASLKLIKRIIPIKKKKKTSVKAKVSPHSKPNKKYVEEYNQLIEQNERLKLEENNLNRNKSNGNKNLRKLKVFNKKIEKYVKEINSEKLGLEKIEDQFNQQQFVPNQLNHNDHPQEMKDSVFSDERPDSLMFTSYIN